MKQHFYYFNFFRVLAALIVLTSHARCEVFESFSKLAPVSQTLSTKGLFFSLSFTTVAMSIFFVLSGFLVGGPALERLFKYRRNEISNVNEDAFNFMINRFIRIVPPLSIAILFAALVKIIGKIEFSWLDALLNAFGLQGVLASDFGGVYWSIAYEVWFYVLIGAIMCLCSKRSVFVLGCILLCVSCMVFLVLSPRWLFTIFLGVVLFFVKGFRITKPLFLLMAGTILVLQLIVVFSGISLTGDLPLHGIVNQELVSWAITFIVAIIMVSFCEVQPHSAFMKQIENFGNKWAPMTYSLYITHFTVFEFRKIILGKIAIINMSSIALMVVWCIICIVIGYAFYRIIEEPLVRYLKAKIVKLHATSAEA